MTERASNTFPVLAHGLVAGAIWLLTSLRSGRRQRKQWRWRPPTKDTFCKYRKCNYSRLFVPVSGNGGRVVELATRRTAGTLMAPTDTAAGVERSLLLKLPLNFYCIAANWLADSSFYPPCEARLAAVGRCVYTRLCTHTGAEWLDGCRAAEQRSAVNLLPGLSTTQLLSSILHRRGNWSDTWFPFQCELCVNSTVVDSVSESDKDLQPFPAGLGHTSLFVLQLCCQSCTGTSLIQVFPGAGLRERLQGVGLASWLNYFTGVTISTVLFIPRRNKSTHHQLDPHTTAEFAGWDTRKEPWQQHSSEAVFVALALFLFLFSFCKAPICVRILLLDCMHSNWGAPVS